MVSKNIKGIFGLWLGTFMGAGLAFLTQVVLARGLGTQSFGEFSSAFALISLVAPLAGFGVSSLWLKVFGVEGWAALRWVRPSLQFVLFSTLLAFFFLALWGLVGGHSRQTAFLILVLSVCLLGQLSFELVSAKLQLEGRFFELAAWQAFQHTFRFLLIAFFFFFFADLFSATLAALIYSAVSFLYFLLCCLSLRNFSSGKVTLEEHPAVESVAKSDKKITWLTVAQESWPFGIAALAHLIYYQSDIVIIKYLIGEESAGYYNVAFTIMAAVYMIPGVLYQKFLMPKIHRWAVHDRNKFFELYRKGNIVMIFFGLLATLSVWLLGDWLVFWLFGPDYAYSSSILKVLAISALIISVAFNAGAVLVTNQYIRLKVLYMLTVAALNVAMNFYSIPIWGVQGAAVTTIISNAILLCLYLYGAERKVFMRGGG